MDVCVCGLRRGGLWLWLCLSIGFAASVSAADQPPGWYVGVEGNALFLDDADNHSRTPDSFTPGEGGTSEECLIPILQQVICLFPTPSTPGTPGEFTPGTELHTRTSFKTGYATGLTIGHAFESGLRPELQLAYRVADFDTITFVDGYGTQNGTTTGAEGEIKSYGFMLNGWYDIKLGSLLRPYLGAGVGGNQVEIDGGVGDSGFILAYQAGAGLGLALTQRMSLSLDYRYLVSEDPSFMEGQSGEFRSEYVGQTVGMGLRYNFAPSGGRDADGDGVPDYLDECPGTPAGVAVDTRGCPLDSDFDGVADHLDKCPNSAPGAAVDKDGCERDSDGDGVPDSIDKCPATPAGSPVDAAGCPRDSDGDGVPDHLDQCPNTPAGEAVDARGCRFTDRDGDGIADNADLCPDTPAGIPVGRDGCPLDSDGDGVPDYLDECPESPAGMAVLPNGCALQGDRRLARAGEATDADGYALDRDFILHGVNFELDSARLTPAAKQILDAAAQTLTSYPTIKLDVEGHTDSSGTDGYNQALSEKRALAVVDYLVSKGIPGAQMTPVGYGESRPIASNATASGMAENRRVVFRVTDEGR